MPRARIAHGFLVVALSATAAGPATAAGSGACPPTTPAFDESANGIDDPGLHAAGDLDADGRGDVIQVDEASTMAAVRGHDGSTIWASPTEIDNIYRTGDLDGAPGDDLIVWTSTVTSLGGGQHREYVIRGVSGKLGTTLWTRSFHSLVNFAARHEGAIEVLAPPVDLDGDGTLDLLLGQYFSEADTAFTRGLFESISGATGQTIARYGGGIGTWYNPVNGPSRQMPFAAAVPDLTGDCVADVVVNASRLSESLVAAFPGTGGAPIWTKQFSNEGNDRVLGVTGAHLNADDIGDVLLSIGSFGTAPISGSQVRLVALEGGDGGELWSSVFPQNLSRLTLQPAADGTGHDILLSGPFARFYGTIGLVDGGTGAIRWQRTYVDAWPLLVGDATGDGVEDIALGFEKCVQGCVPTHAELISSADGSVSWTRLADGGEKLVPLGDDLDGDGRADLFAFREGVSHGQPSFYSAVSGQDGELLWESYRRMDDALTILRVDALDVRPDEPGVDVLEGFRAEDHVDGPAARPGNGTAPLWYR